MSKRRVSEPGYRYAEERRKYMALSPADRLKAKLVLEAVWNGRGCEPRYKARSPCPSLNEITEEQLQDAVHNFYKDEDR